MRLSAAVLTCLVMFSATGFLSADESSDEASINDLFSKFSKSWDEPGMPGFEDLFAEDADFVVITGRRLTGRGEIVQYHRELLQSVYKGSRSQLMKAESLRFVRPDVAIAHVTSGATFMQDGKEVTRTGRATAVVIKQNGKWLISAFHNTLTSGPGAIAPRPRN